MIVLSKRGTVMAVYRQPNMRIDDIASQTALDYDQVSYLTDDAINDEGGSLIAGNDLPLHYLGTSTTAQKLIYVFTDITPGPSGDYSDSGFPGAPCNVDDVGAYLQVDSRLRFVNDASAPYLPFSKKYLLTCIDELGANLLKVKVAFVDGVGSRQFKTYKKPMGLYHILESDFKSIPIDEATAVAFGVDPGDYLPVLANPGIRFDIYDE